MRLSVLHVCGFMLTQQVGVITSSLKNHFSASELQNAIYSIIRAVSELANLRIKAIGSWTEWLLFFSQALTSDDEVVSVFGDRTLEANGISLSV